MNDAKEMKDADPRPSLQAVFDAIVGPGYEAHTAAMSVALEELMGAGDELFAGLRVVARSGKAYLRATWRLHVASWPLNRPIWALYLRGLRETLVKGRG